LYHFHITKKSHKKEGVTSPYTFLLFPIPKAFTKLGLVLNLTNYSLEISKGVGFKYQLTTGEQGGVVKLP